jgi:hypothetical protein
MESQPKVAMTSWLWFSSISSGKCDKYWGKKETVDSFSPQISSYMIYKHLKFDIGLLHYKSGTKINFNTSLFSCIYNYSLWLLRWCFLLRLWVCQCNNSSPLLMSKSKLIYDWQSVCLMLLPWHVLVIGPPDDGSMTETCCGNNIGRGEEELLHWWTHNCFVNFTFCLHQNTI